MFQTAMSVTSLRRYLSFSYKHLYRLPVSTQNNVKIVKLTTCSVLKCSDEYKSDPDIKKFMRFGIVNHLIIDV